MSGNSDNPTQPPLTPADCRLDEGGEVVCERFGDIYYSVDDGLAESRYVFLDHNDLPARWASSESFTIIETGFGTGLNFLAAWQLWRQTAGPGSKLHYWAVEKYPVEKAMLTEILTRWAELADLAGELLEHYPPLEPGRHCLSLDGGRVELNLLFGDAREMIPPLDTQADAWFLDGFAPGKNPDMWSDELFQAMGKLTPPGGTFATFTAAGVVKRGLRANGFFVKRAPGHGKKWHMLQGHRLA